VHVVILPLPVAGTLVIAGAWHVVMLAGDVVISLSL